MRIQGSVTPAPPPPLATENPANQKPQHSASTCRPPTGEQASLQSSHNTRLWLNFIHLCTSAGIKSGLYHQQRDIDIQDEPWRYLQSQKWPRRSLCIMLFTFITVKIVSKTAYVVHNNNSETQIPKAFEDFLFNTRKKYNIFEVTSYCHIYEPPIQHDKTVLLMCLAFLADTYYVQ